MPLYIGDYLKDTMRLNTMEHGAYMLLLMDYWVNGAPPDNDDTLAKIARTTAKEWAKMRLTLAAYFQVQDGFWFHKRVEEELVKAGTRVLTKRASGRAGGIAARGKSGRKPNSKKIAEPIADQIGKNTPSPSPSPSPEERTNLELPREDAPVFQFCAALGIDWRSDQSRIHWPALLHEAQAEGLDFKTHILPAALETRARGKASIEYALKVARSKRDAQAKTPPPAPAEIEYADERRWFKRMEIFRETGTWLEKWGPKWGEPGCLCPPEAIPPFLDRRPQAQGAG